MPSETKSLFEPNGGASAFRAFLVLHPVLALTGILHAIGGPLLPSLASTFHLNDSQSGLLLFMYFSGSSLGALLCVGRYARMMAAGFALVVACCFDVSVTGWPASLFVFFFLGIGVGLPMSAVNLYVGRMFPKRAASALTLLNFTWTAGALLAPLLAVRVLEGHTFRAAYIVLGVAAALAAFIAMLFLHDDQEGQAVRQDAAGGRSNVRAIVVLASIAFLQVGVENLSLAWLPTYISRTAATGIVLGAGLTTCYWIGYLASRALASLILLRVRATHILRIAVPAAFIAALGLIASSSLLAASIAMFLLGLMLGPVYPLVIAQSFSELRRTSDTRWVLAAAGFGGSVLPWLTGWLSTHFGGIRSGLLTLPAALLAMTLLFSMNFKKKSEDSAYASELRP